MNERSRGTLKVCHPLLAHLAAVFDGDQQGILMPGDAGGLLSFEVTLSHRERDEQEALWKSGRDFQGKLVNAAEWRTNAHWDESWHSCLPRGLCCALDYGIFDHHSHQFAWPNPRDKDPEKAERARVLWEEFAARARAVGLTPGFDWKDKDGLPLDSPHVQLNLGPYTRPKLFTAFTAKMPEEVISSLITTLWKRSNPQVVNKLALQDF